jgi:hypothetical protein
MDLLDAFTGTLVVVLVAVLLYPLDGGEDR